MQIVVCVATHGVKSYIYVSLIAICDPYVQKPSSLLLCILSSYHS